MGKKIISFGPQCPFEAEGIRCVKDVGDHKYHRIPAVRGTTYVISRAFVQSRVTRIRRLLSDVDLGINKRAAINHVLEEIEAEIGGTS